MTANPIRVKDFHLRSIGDVVPSRLDDRVDEARHGIDGAREIANGDFDLPLRGIVNLKQRDAEDAVHARQVSYVLEELDGQVVNGILVRPHCTSPDARVHSRSDDDRNIKAVESFRRCAARVSRNLNQRASSLTRMGQKDLATNVAIVISLVPLRVGPLAACQSHYRSDVDVGQCVAGSWRYEQVDAHNRRRDHNPKKPIFHEATPAPDRSNLDHFWRRKNPVHGFLA